MTVQAMAAMLLGFVFGWLGRWAVDTRTSVDSFSEGFASGLKEAAKTINARCEECEKAGEPNPMKVRVETRRIDS